VEEGRRLFPGDERLTNQYLRTLYYLGRNDDGIVIVTRELAPEIQSPWLGYFNYRKGKLDEALRGFDHRLAEFPRDLSAHLGRVMTHFWRGDWASAAADMVRAESIEPNAGGLEEIWRSFRSPAMRQYFAPHWEELDRAYARAMERGLDAPRILGLRALACVYKPQPDLSLALELADKAVEKTRERDPEMLGYLGEVLAARAEIAEAIRALEHAAALPGTWQAAGEDLVALRRKFLPRLASCRSVDAFLAGEIPEVDGREAGDRDVVHAALVSESPELAAYLEAALLEETGQSEAASNMLERMAVSEKLGRLDREVATLRLVGIREGRGQLEDALRLVEENCLRSPLGTFVPWFVWMRIVSAIEKSDAAAIANRLDALTSSWVADASGDKDETGTAGDIRWVLTTLRDAGTVRINCGGKDYTDSQGNLWGADRCFDGGQAYGRFTPELHGTVERALYWENRYFTVGNYLRPGYRIPLPSGIYEVVLHFCDTSGTPVPQSFDAVVEGTKVADGIDPFAKPGFGKPFTVSGQVDLHDGCLDIDLIPKMYYVAVKAIEVRLIERR
jgi:tetratricopeptide (TPR) repeat protein